jgi:hypothetical protein
MADIDFLEANLKLDNFRPFVENNTTGLFDARMEVSKGFMQINVKLYFDFGPLFLGTTGMTSSRFREKYRRQIARYWDGRYRLFAADTLGNKHYFKAEIGFTEVQDRASAHFVADIRRLHVSTSYVNKQENRQSRCVLYSDAVKSRPKGFVTKMGWKASLGGTREKLLQRQAKADLAGVVQTITFDQNLATMRNAPLIEGISKLFTENMATRPLVKLRVTGYVLHNEDRTLAMTRAKKVVTDLHQRGIPEHLMLAVSGGIGSKGCARVTLDPASIQEVLNVPSNFPIAAHEFGHQLGLLDEYFRSEETVAKDIDEYTEMTRMARQLGVQMPQFQANTLSLMSVGDKVLPFHYLPFYAAAERMRSNWRTGVNNRKAEGANPLNGTAGSLGIELVPVNALANQAVDEELILG